jgi:hypothetical protein
MLVSSMSERFAVVLTTCVVLNLAVTGCSREPEDTIQTVDYYRAHPKDRHTLLARCINDPGRLGNKPSCINAKQAENLEGVGSMRSLPPMGLSKESSPASGAAPPPTPSPGR